MPHASIFTLDAAIGGVPALARTVYNLLVSAGHSPELVYRASEEVPTTSWMSKLGYFLTTPPVRRMVKNTVCVAAIADYPFPPRYKYHLLRIAHSALRAPIMAVVSGSSHEGLPLALSRHPYVLWAATIYEEELQGRAVAGDGWARDFLRHPDWPILESQERLVYERASVILSLSPHTTSQIAARWPGLKNKLRTVIYPVNTDQFRPAEGPADPPYLLLTARIRDPRKNVQMLLRAFERVRAEFPRLRLIIAGDDPLPATLDIVSYLGLGDSVQFPGHIPADSSFTALYQQATLFVFPSLQEGLGISVLDAMACGVPVVATRCGGPEGLVQHGITGLLVANGDEDQFTEAILDLLRHPERAKLMGMAGRDYVLRTCARPQIESQLRAAFNDTFPGVF